MTGHQRAHMIGNDSAREITLALASQVKQKRCCSKQQASCNCCPTPPWSSARNNESFPSRFFLFSQLVAQLRCKFRRGLVTQVRSLDSFAHGTIAGHLLRTISAVSEVVFELHAAHEIELVVEVR